MDVPIPIRIVHMDMSTHLGHKYIAGHELNMLRIGPHITSCQLYIPHTLYTCNYKSSACDFHTETKIQYTIASYLQFASLLMLSISVRTSMLIYLIYGLHPMHACDYFIRGRMYFWT